MYLYLLSCSQKTKRMDTHADTLLYYYIILDVLIIHIRVLLIFRKSLKVLLLLLILFCEAPCSPSLKGGFSSFFPVSSQSTKDNISTSLFSALSKVSLKCEGASTSRNGEKQIFCVCVLFGGVLFFLFFTCRWLF